MLENFCSISIRNFLKKSVFKLGFCGFLIICLVGCESPSALLDGEKVSIFNTVEADEFVDKKIILERPVLNEQWISDGGNELNNVGHVAGRKNLEKLFSVDVGSVSEENQILYTPVSDGKTVYTVDGKLRVVAIDLSNGKKRKNLIMQRK